MNKHGIRIAACALAGTFALSGYYTSLQAKINQSSTLPAAGIAVVLEEGTTIQELTQEVIQNIAYLERTGRNGCCNLWSKSRIITGSS